MASAEWLASREVRCHRAWGQIGKVLWPGPHLVTSVRVERAGQAGSALRRSPQSCWLRGGGSRLGTGLRDL